MARTNRTKPIRATTATYDAARERVVLDLTNGVSIGIPLSQLPEIAAAPKSERSGVEVIGAGNVLHWEALDADYSVPALLIEAIGNRLALRMMGRAGGRARSHAKATAARVNGQKGGRPRKTPAASAK